MPDPQRDLAPIIELPAAQPPTAAHDHGPLLPMLGLLCLIALLAAGVVWFRHRTAPIRTIRKLARATEPRRAADALAALVAASAIEPGASWRQELERLRFGRPGADDAATLARLCTEAESASRRRR